jgi:hypothetical protein
MIRALVIGAVTFALAAAADAAGDNYKQDQEGGPGAGPVAVKPEHGARRAPYRDCCGEEGYRFVYAEGWYGSKKIVAPVRHADLGDQVRLPGGTWVYCELSCEYTLRKQTLDFWERARGQEQNVPLDYPRKDFYIDSWGQRRGYLF